jgi:Fe-S cluster assembly protein SufD
LDRYQRLAEPSAATAPDPALEKLAAAPESPSALVRTRDGFLTSSPFEGGPVSVVPLGSLPGAPEPVAASFSDVFVLANRAFSPDPIVVRIAPGARAATVVIVHEVVADAALILPHVRIEAGSDSEATIVEMFGGPGHALVAPLTEIDVAPAARISYVGLQLLGPQAWQIGRQSSLVGADARFVSAAVSLGGDYARLRTDSALVGPGASNRLLAVYFGSGAQMHDFRTKQDHRVPKTTSDLLYKGVVANTSRSVYSGLIRVEKGARGTNAFQTNRNLVLHEGAHADSVPNLEIEDNDVRCSHASAVGPVSEDQRFYLESRGVPPQVTERLIALGFVGEVLAELPAPALVPVLTEMVAAKLAEAEKLEVSR